MFPLPSALETPHSATGSHGEAILQKDLMFQQYRNISSFYLTRLKTNPPILHYSNITGVSSSEHLRLARLSPRGRTKGEGAERLTGCPPGHSLQQTSFRAFEQGGWALRRHAAGSWGPSQWQGLYHPSSIAIICFFICPVLLWREHTI